MSQNIKMEQPNNKFILALRITKATKDKDSEDQLKYQMMPSLARSLSLSQGTQVVPKISSKDTHW